MKSAPVYRERLGPSLWAMVAAALSAPMAALVFVQLNPTLALAVGAVVGAAIIALMIAGSPVVEIRNGWLYAGRAHIEVRHLGGTEVFRGDEARAARGVGLHPRSWHVIRGGIDGIAVIEVTDPDDPCPSWVISSRTPDRLAAAVRSTEAAASRA
ncbi:DUF3093 domain-containing protein [Microbacterium sp. P01]|uniref:DUF3093 domain-containing protein n=1 Tax=Microbacterium sp. P01 TaxID=3366261 RepID=UPI00367269A2